MSDIVKGAFLGVVLFLLVGGAVGVIRFAQAVSEDAKVCRLASERTLGLLVQMVAR